MKIILLLSFVFCFFVEGSSVLNIFEENQSHSFLKQQLKRDISYVFPPSFKPAVFIQAFENKDFKKSLDLWIESIQGTSFDKSSTGAALYSYLLFKNQFEYLSLYHLFKNSKPREIHPLVRQLWKENIKHPIWNYFYFPLIDENWQLFFTPEIALQITSKSPFNLTKDHDFIKSLLAVPVKESFDSFSLEWFFMLSFIKKGDNEAAAKLLSWFLSQTEEKSFKRDKVYITIARLLADIQEHSAALYYYRKVTQPSYFMLLAREEMTWILLDQKKNSQALETALTLSHPGFSLSPSMFFVSALTHFKNCDYQGAVQNLMRFKKVFSEKRDKLKNIVKAKNYHYISKELLSFYYSGKDSSVIDIPNWFYHLRSDQTLKNQILLYHYLQNKIKNSSVLFKNLQKKERALIKAEQKRRDKRLEFLFKQELDNVNRFLTYFHILEAEILYRYYGAKKLLSFSSKKKSFFDGAALNQFKGFYYFPFNRDEIWLNEILSYKVRKNNSCSYQSYKL